MLVLFFGISEVTFGQALSVTGTVSDLEGQPMPGVTVVIQGTTTGTMTDIDGHYTIKVPSAESVFIILVHWLFKRTNCSW